jgi:hypothetical protein
MALINIDCKNLKITMTGGYIEVDCKLKKKKCMDCNFYETVIKENSLVELTGLLKPLTRTNKKLLLKGKRGI